MKWFVCTNGEIINIENIERIGKVFDGKYAQLFQIWFLSGDSIHLNADNYDSFMEAIGVYKQQNRYSFDDLGIGRLKDGGKSLDEKGIDRPAGISKSDWYKFAGEVVKLLNLCKEEKINWPENEIVSESVIPSF